MHGVTMHNPFDPGYYQSDELRGFGFAQVGDNVRIAKNCTIIGPENIRIGDNVRIDAGTIIIASSGFLTLGSFIHIGSGCLLGCRGGLTIDGFGGMSHGVKIFTASDDFSGRSMVSCGVAPEHSDVRIAPVRMGLHCSIGANSVVLPGANFGEGAVLGALSMAVRPLRPWTVYMGNPARKFAARAQDCVVLAAQYERTFAQAA